MNAKLAFPLLVTLASVMSARTAQAIPAFARAYGVSCSTCHTTIPRRNEFGDAFRRAGYHWPKAVGENSNELAVPSAEENRTGIIGTGQSAMMTLVPKQVPLTLVAIGSTSYSNAPVNPYGISYVPAVLVSAAALGDHISYFSSVLVVPFSVAFENYLHFARIADRPELNLRVGYLAPWLTQFRADEALVGSGWFLSSKTINGFLVGDAKYGIELNGTVLGRASYSVGAVRASPTDPHTALYYSVGGKGGGLTFLGDDTNLNLDDSPWHDDVRVSVGHWGYFGRISPTSPLAHGHVTQIRRYGVDLKAAWRNATLWSGLMIGDDSDITTQKHAASTSWFAEASYSFLPWLSLFYQFEHQGIGTGIGDGGLEDSLEHDVMLAILPVENLRLTVTATKTNAQVADKMVSLALYLAL